MDERMCLIGADNQMLDTNFTGDPEAIEPGQRVIPAPLNIDDPDGLEWDPTIAPSGGWKMKIQPVVLITVGRFLLLLTLGEQAAIHTAAKTDMEVAAMLFMLQGFTDGISLTDPALAAFGAVMVGKGLLTSDRVTAILAGEAP